MVHSKPEGRLKVALAEMNGKRTVVCVDVTFI